MTTSGRSVSRAPVVIVIGFFAVALTLVVIGAWRSGQQAAPPPVTSPGTAASPRAVNVIMRDYLFEPTPVVLIPGETVRFTILNAGMVEHEFVLGDAAVQDAWAAADAAATPPAPLATSPPASVPPDVGGLRVLVASGAQAVVDYTVPAQGLLELVCHLPEHEAHGMVGKVVLGSP